MASTLAAPGSRADQALSLNMRLVAHELRGFGGIGEGMAMHAAGARPHDGAEAVPLLASRERHFWTRVS